MWADYAQADYFDCFDSKNCAKALSTSQDCKQPGDYNITRPSVSSSATSVTVLSFHGGGIEANTSDISKRLKHLYGWDRYDLNGHVTSTQCSSLDTDNKLKTYQILHITSTHFDDPDALALVGEHPNSVAIHGYSKSRTDSHRNYSKETICVGGASNTQIAAFINYVNTNKSVFKSSPEGYSLLPINAPSVPDPPRDMPEDRRPACYDLKGVDLDNIVNRNSSKRGLQLEFSRDMRKDLANLGNANFNSLRSVIYGAIDRAMSTDP